MNHNKRLFFVFPLLAISMWVFGIVQNFNTFSEFSNAKFSQQQEKKELTKITHSNFEEGEIIIIESESEIEIDTDWFGFENLINNFNSTRKEKKVQPQEFSTFSLHKTIPLYDLYCNWKFHLS